MIKIWKFIKSAVNLIHKLIMSFVHLRELTYPVRKQQQVPFSLAGFLFGY